MEQQKISNRMTTEADDSKGLGPAPAGVGSLSQLQEDLLAQLENRQRLTKKLRKMKNRLVKRVNIVKKSFFASLVALLVESQNNVLHWISLFLEFCQNLSFCFIDIEWGPYGNALGFFLDIIQVEQVVVNIGGVKVIVYLAIVSLVLIITMIGLALYVVRSFISSDFNAGIWPLRLLRTLVSMLASIFFLPITYTLFGIFTCKEEQGACASNPLHVTLRVLSAIFLPLFLMFTLLMSMTYFHPNPKSNSIVARPTARLEIMELSSKAMLSAFYVFFKELPVLRAAVTFLNAIALGVFMFIFVPYYNKTFNVFRFVLMAEVLWGSIVAIAMALMQGQQYPIHIHNFVFYGYCAVTPVVAFVSYYTFSRYLDYATSYEIAVNNFKVDNSNFNAWEVEEQDKKSQEKRFWHPSQVEIATRFLICNADPDALEVADQMFLHGIQKFPHSADLMVSYAIFFLVYKNDTSMASNYLKKALATKPFIDTEFTIYQQEQELRNGARTVGNKKLDAVDRVEFKQLMKKATMYHREAKASIANFWQTIMLADEDAQVDTSTLINLVSQMEWSDRNAIVAYRQLLVRFPLSVRVLRHYAMFLEEIHNNRDESKKIQKQIKTIQDAGMSDELPSITAHTLALFSHDSRSKKEKKQYMEYRKQVYLYSKANSSQLNWMIRGVQLALLIIAIAQMLVVMIGSNIIRGELEWLKVTNNCRGALLEIHQGIRLSPPGNLSFITDSTSLQYSTIRSAVETLDSNSSYLFENTAKRSAAYNAWVRPNIGIDTYQSTNTIPIRNLRNVSMRDATLLYLRRANLTLSASSTIPIDSNPDIRFLLDNGIITLSNAFGRLQFILAELVQQDVILISFLQLGVWVLALIFLITLGFGVFLPVIGRAKSDRETSLRAFLQIPKLVTQVLFRKYYDPGAASKEDLTQEEEKGANSDSDDDFTKKSDIDVLNVRAQTEYFKLSKMSIQALLIIAVSYSIAMWATYGVGLAVAPAPGIIVSGLSIFHVVSRVATVVRDITFYGNTTYNITNTLRPWASLQTILEEDSNKIIYLTSSILYGNESLGIPLHPLSSQYGITVLDRIPTDRNPFKTVYDAVSIFIDNTLSLARSNQISPNQPVIMDIIRDEVLISTGYNQFLHQFSRDTSLRLDLFVNVAAGVFAVVIATIFASYFLYWRRILDYLVKTENERTLKLLLMIPVEIVADIDSLRELLHLKRSKVSSKSAEITTQQQQLLIARSPSNAEQEHSVFHRRAGAVRSRPISQVYSAIDSNIIHTRIMGETPEVTPIDESFANRTVVAQFMEKMAGTAQPENNTTPPSSLPTSTGPPLQSIRGSMSNIANLPVRHRRSSYSSLHTAGIAENNSARIQSGERRSLSSDLRMLKVDETPPPPVPPIPESLRIGRRGSMRQAHIDMNKGVAVIRKETTSSEGGKKHGNQGDQDEDHS